MSTYRKAQYENVSPINFDIDVETGFLPRRPLPQLPKPFGIWETALREAPDVLSLGEDGSNTAAENHKNGELWRTRVKSLPLLDVDVLKGDRRLLQRAHMVLAWLVHFLVHSMPPANDGVHVPRSLAIPLVEVSRALGMAPALTFADTVLWNWELIDPSLPTAIENMRFVNIFSGTDDERNFFATSARAELKGVEILRIIDGYQSLPDATDLTSISRISKDLTRLAGIIEDIKEVIQSVRDNCDPRVFYWDIRPWLEGSDASGPSGMGWIYDGVDNSENLDLSGPSGGQSSVMHALDIFLDVDHKLQQRRSPAPSECNKKADRGFMERMTRYMPGKHRDYLSHLAGAPCPIRELVLKTPTLREPYNSAVMALKKLRDLHMRIACLYIVTMSRSTSIPAGCPVSVTLARMEANRAARQGPARGTGGNEVSKLLKAGRDATRRTLISDGD